MSKTLVAALGAVLLASLLHTEATLSLPSL